MMRLPPLRRRLALWLCPDLGPVAPQRLATLSDLPQFPGKSAPAWWSNDPLREFLTQAHRKLLLVEAHALAVTHFGDAAPSRSALHRYWQLLDAQRDPPPKPKKES